MSLTTTPSVATPEVLQHFRAIPLYLPAQGKHTLVTIDRASAIVGEPDGLRRAPTGGDDPHRVIWYEGNRHGSGDLRRFIDRAVVAAWRAVDRSPTTAFMAAEVEELEQIGTLDLEASRVHLEPEAAPRLAAWLAIPDGPMPDEELISTAGRAGQVRMWRQALDLPDMRPVHAKARRELKRLDDAWIATVERVLEHRAWYFASSDERAAMRALGENGRQGPRR